MIFFLSVCNDDVNDTQASQQPIGQAAPHSTLGNVLEVEGYDASLECRKLAVFSHSSANGLSVS